MRYLSSRWLCLVYILSVIGGLTGCGPSAHTLLSDEAGIEGGITVIEAKNEGRYAIVRVTLPFLNIYGEPRIGQARMVVKRTNVRTNEKIPGFCHVHYELSINDAQKWADEGWAVFSAVYNDQAPIGVSVGDGYNQARALIQWARRCPFVDSARLHLDGGSQGGYMVLAMSAAMFPVVSATADVPVVNWAYNLNYFESNRPLTAGYATPFESPMPILASVTPLADMCYEHFPQDLTHDTWYQISPISYLDEITNPVLVTCITGDMLVPIEQIYRHSFSPDDWALFPAGYIRDFDKLAPTEKTRITLIEALPEAKRALHRVPRQEHSYLISKEMRLKKEDHPKKKPDPLNRPWDPAYQWNICILDEGPPVPWADHSTWAWNTHPKRFVDFYRQKPPSSTLLTVSKLEHLLKRYVGSQTEYPLLKDGTSINRLNFATLEKIDVLSALISYAKTSEVHKTNLDTLYALSSIKPFGTEVNLDHLRTIQQQLLKH